jgi:hypothetical protein
MPRIRCLCLLIVAVWGALFPGAADALIGIRVEVIGDASGTLAAGVQESDGTVAVTPSPADTAHTISGYVGFNVIDAGEIGFAASADLSGLGFLAGFEGNPSAVSDLGTVTTTQLYEVTYDLGTPDSASGVDWQLDVAEVHQGFPAENNVDPAANAASVQIDAPAAGVPALGGRGVALLMLALLAARLCWPPRLHSDRQVGVSGTVPHDRRHSVQHPHVV